MLSPRHSVLRTRRLDGGTRFRPLSILRHVDICHVYGLSPRALRKLQVALELSCLLQRTRRRHAQALVHQQRRFDLRAMRAVHAAPQQFLPRGQRQCIACECVLSKNATDIFGREREERLVALIHGGDRAAREIVRLVSASYNSRIHDCSGIMSRPHPDHVRQGARGDSLLLGRQRRAVAPRGRGPRRAEHAGPCSSKLQQLSPALEIIVVFLKKEEARKQCRTKATAVFTCRYC